MSDDNRLDQATDEDHDLDEALVPRLRLIEDQPLEGRADAYAVLYDELRARLEDADPGNGRRQASD